MLYQISPMLGKIQAYIESILSKDAISRKQQQTTKNHPFNLIFLAGESRFLLE